MAIIMIIMIAVSLSMDAFSLSLAYGTLNLSKKNMRNLSFIVGGFHFVMPIIGMWIGNGLFKILPIRPEVIVFLVLMFIGIQMIIETFKKEEDVHFMNTPELFLFGLAVSIDSFSVGIGLHTLTHHPFLAALIFSFSSFIFTYLGLLLGKKIHNMVGKISTFIGGIALILIGILYLM